MGRLEDERIGKAIIIELKRDNISPGEQAKFGVSIPSEREYIHLGQILSCDLGEKSHIVITAGGEVMYIETNTPDPGGVIQYQKFFSSIQENNEIADALQRRADSTDPHSLLQVIRQYQHTYAITKIVEPVDNESYQLVMSKFDQSLAIARKLREQREEAKARATSAVIEKLKDFFKPPSDEPPPAPPQE